MYKSAIAGLFACSLIIVIANSSTAKAEPLSIQKIVASHQTLTEVLEKSVNDTQGEQQAEHPVKSEPASHTVQPKESLSTIATHYQTTWKRLFDKNTSIEDPNVISSGQNILIPRADEVLIERVVPQPVAELVSNTPTPVSSAKSKPAVSPHKYTAERGSSAGNRYSPGYCTWYVKNMRPDLPNNLGNANTWVSRAAAQGIPTGSAPKVGAVGQRGMHVVYVEAVNADGTVTISEMNHKGVYVRTVRTLPANYFTYIY